MSAIFLLIFYNIFLNFQNKNKTYQLGKFIKKFFYMDHFKILYWICYNIASVLCFGFLAMTYEAS